LKLNVTSAEGASEPIASLIQAETKKNNRINKDNDNGIEEEHLDTEQLNHVVSRNAMLTYVATEDSVLLQWKFEDLAEILHSSVEMRANLTRAMTASVVKKVVNLYTSKSIGDSWWWKKR